MAFMKTCCCFEDMRNACKATAIFAIVTAILSVIWHLSSLLSTNIVYWSEDHIINISFAVLAFDGLLLLCGFLLLNGTSQGYKGRNSLLAFIVLMPVYLAVSIALGIYSYYTISSIFGTSTWKSVPIIIGLIIWIIPIIFFILGEMAAISLYRQLKERGPDYGTVRHRKQRLSDPHPGHRLSSHNPPSLQQNGKVPVYQSNILQEPVSLKPSQIESRFPKSHHKFGKRHSFLGDYSDIYHPHHSDPGYLSSRPPSYPGRQQRPLWSSLYGSSFTSSPAKIHSGLYGNHSRPSSLVYDYF